MIETIKKICLRNQDIESCGLFIRNRCGTILLYPCENVHKTPESDFEISAERIVKAEKIGEIIGIYHSHTKKCLKKPSEFDHYHADVMDLFSLVYIIDDDKFYLIDPNKRVDEHIKKQLYL